MQYQQPYQYQQNFQPNYQQQYQQNYQQQYPTDVLNGYKMQYQAPQQNQPTNEIIWVQGEAGAKGYLVAPNNSVVLWDTESATIYVKTADANGIPSMRILDFTERNQPVQEKEHKCKCGDKFVSKEDFEMLKSDFDAFKQQILDSASEKPKAKSKKEE